MLTMGLALAFVGGTAEAAEIASVRVSLTSRWGELAGDREWEGTTDDRWSDYVKVPSDGIEMWGGHFVHSGRHGMGIWADEWLETRFEKKFERLMNKYDEGLADVEDFYNSEEYMNVVDGVELLIERHDSFLMKVEWSVEDVGDLIDHANEHLMRIEDWLAKDDTDEMMPWKDHMWHDEWLMRAEDILTMKIETLTMKQETLMEKLSMYQSFHMELTDYLDQIVDAANPSGAAVAAAALLPGVTLPIDTAIAVGHVTSSPVSLATVPEPPTWLPLAIAAAVVGLWRRTFDRRRRVCRVVHFAAELRAAHWGRHPSAVKGR
jgi:hypothetical protein